LVAHGWPKVAKPHGRKVGFWLAAKLQTQYAEKILLVDVRSHGYYDPHADRIRGSIRLEPNNLSEEAKELPRDKDIYLYCT